MLKEKKILRIVLFLEDAIILLFSISQTVEIERGKDWLFFSLSKPLSPISRIFAPKRDKLIGSRKPESKLAYFFMEDAS